MKKLLTFIFLFTLTVAKSQNLLLEQLLTLLETSELKADAHLKSKDWRLEKMSGESLSDRIVVWSYGNLGVAGAQAWFTKKAQVVEYQAPDESIFQKIREDTKVWKMIQLIENKIEDNAICNVYASSFYKVYTFAEIKPGATTPNYIVMVKKL